MSFANTTFQTRIERQSLIAVVASQWSVSDRFLALLDAEFASLDVERFENLSQIKTKMSETGQYPALMMIDAPGARDLVEDADGVLVSLSRLTQVAICYRDAEEVADVFQSIEEAELLPSIGFVPINVSIDAVIAQMHCLLAGMVAIPLDCLPFTGQSGAVQKMSHEDQVALASAALTERENDVIKLAANCLSNKEIAKELNISIHTVKLHMHNLMRKSGSQNRMGAVAWFQNGQHGG